MKTLVLNSVLLSILIVGFSLFTNAQNPFDCIDAIDICNDESLNIQYGFVFGTVDEDIEDLCYDDLFASEYLSQNTVWLKYHFVTNGNFLFTITPTNWEDDIDFVAFTSESESCNDLMPIRCMFTGQNIGEPVDSSCHGATGLAINSIDTSEYIGCGSNDDSFLAPINVNAGDIIYLAVSSYSGPSDYIIEHSGSAIISCIPLETSSLATPKIKMFPNPIRNEFWVETNGVNGKKMQLELINTNGQKILNRTFINQIKINVKEMPKGIYFVKILQNNTPFIVEKLIKVE